MSRNLLVSVDMTHVAAPSYNPDDKMTAVKVYADPAIGFVVECTYNNNVSDTDETHFRDFVVAMANVATLCGVDVRSA